MAELRIVGEATTRRTARAGRGSHPLSELRSPAPLWSQLRPWAGPACPPSLGAVPLALLHPEVTRWRSHHSLDVWLVSLCPVPDLSALRLGRVSQPCPGVLLGLPHTWCSVEYRILQPLGRLGGRRGGPMGPTQRPPTSNVALSTLMRVGSRLPEERFRTQSSAGGVWAAPSSV